MEAGGSGSCDDVRSDAPASHTLEDPLRSSSVIRLGERMIDAAERHAISLNSWMGTMTYIYIYIYKAPPLRQNSHGRR